jgi:voltage-gated potassium channel
VNITAFILSSDHHITHAVGHRIFNIIEAFSVGVFSIEHILRVWSCIGDPEYKVHGAFWGRLKYSYGFHGVIDLLAIV